MCVGEQLQVAGHAARRAADAARDDAELSEPGREQRDDAVGFAEVHAL
jgi:hypothetical protein